MAAELDLTENIHSTLTQAEELFTNQSTFKKKIGETRERPESLVFVQSWEQTHWERQQGRIIHNNVFGLFGLVLGSFCFCSANSKQHGKMPLA